MQEISSITRALKELARELNVPIVAGSQLSRAPEQRQPHIPMLSDLRESGSIEQDADVVLFIYREDMYCQPRRLGGDAPGPPGRPVPARQGDRSSSPSTATARPASSRCASATAISKFEDFELPAGEPALR